MPRPNGLAFFVGISLTFGYSVGILLKISNVLLTKMLSVAASPEGRTGWHKYKPAQDAMTPPGFILSSGVSNSVVVVLEYCARPLRRAFWSTGKTRKEVYNRGQKHKTLSLPTQRNV